MAIELKSYIDIAGNEVIINPDEFYHLESGYYYDEDGEEQSCDRYCIGTDEDGDGLSVWIVITATYSPFTNTWRYKAVEVEEAFND